MPPKTPTQNATTTTIIYVVGIGGAILCFPTLFTGCFAVYYLLRLLRFEAKWRNILERFKRQDVLAIDGTVVCHDVDYDYSTYENDPDGGGLTVSYIVSIQYQVLCRATDTTLIIRKDYTDKKIYDETPSRGNSVDVLVLPEHPRSGCPKVYLEILERHWLKSKGCLLSLFLICAMAHLSLPLLILLTDFFPAQVPIAMLLGPSFVVPLCFMANEEVISEFLNGGKLVSQKRAVCPTLNATIEIAVAKTSSELPADDNTKETESVSSESSA